ncbi:hypothetical protein EGJ86_07250 [Pseudomonas sp. o96-267]|uniref:hypothetical protein n=1 Tax=Pseudomonas sp. o96-267 TaxID=2479853 RepID=UPI000F7880BF|nr:hypothetical protein [Pseudomonas sp. o96-267]RRV41272.1 hypothetical protein EGJ86_07250 [Pseudomonas sp. o96-267]
MNDLGVIEIRIGTENFRISPKLASRLSTLGLRLGPKKPDAGTELQLLKARVARLEQQMLAERG